MHGFALDTKIRLTQEVLTEHQLVTRSYFDVWPAIVCFSIGWANVNPRLNRGALELMNAWCKYDNYSISIQNNAAIKHYR